MCLGPRVDEVQFVKDDVGLTGPAGGQLVVGVGRGLLLQVAVLRHVLHGSHLPIGNAEVILSDSVVYQNSFPSRLHILYGSGSGELITSHFGVLY